jgi:hypothetical protein
VRYVAGTVTGPLFVENTLSTVFHDGGVEHDRRYRRTFDEAIHDENGEIKDAKVIMLCNMHTGKPGMTIHFSAV